MEETMDWRLFFGTFGLIFLAELGDKTQLASMAASAGTKSPLSVFAGASLALVTSTLIAVLVGSTIHRLVPEHYIKILAAILFFTFGAFFLVDAISSRKVVHAGSTVAPQGLLAKAALHSAMEFERSSAAEYDRLAAEVDNLSLRSLFSHLAGQERSHLDRIQTITEKQLPEHITQPDMSIPKVDRLMIKDKTTTKILDSALKQEKDTALFYTALSKASIIPEIRKTFAMLAAEEESHIAHLEEFMRKGSTEIS
jgi:Ca2+/H+ antiporter, TMEM165/GDT1 family